MSWTYSGNPSASPLDEVRFLVGDTNKDDKLLENEEINYLISVSPAGNAFAAAALGAEGIAAYYARKADKSIGPIRVSYSQLSKQFEALADRLWANAGINKSDAVIPLPMYFGGLSQSEKDRSVQDRDLVQPTFWRDQFHSVDMPVGDVRFGRSGEDEE